MLIKIFHQRRRRHTGGNEVYNAHQETIYNFGRSLWNLFVNSLQEKINLSQWHIKYIKYIIEIKAHLSNIKMREVNQTLLSNLNDYFPY